MVKFLLRPLDGPVAQSNGSADSPVLEICTGIRKRMPQAKTWWYYLRTAPYFSPLSSILWNSCLLFCNPAGFSNPVRATGLCGHALLLSAANAEHPQLLHHAPPPLLPQRLKWHLIADKCNILVRCFCFISIVTFLDDPSSPPAPPFATTYAALINIMNSSGVPGLMESAAWTGSKTNM